MEQIITWLADLLATASWWPWAAQSSAAIIVWVVYGLILAFGVAPAAMIVLTWMERKVLARIQDRLGPNRAGPFGIFQAVADAIKMLVKEDITPTGADRVPYNIAPALSAVSAVLVFAVIPFAPGIIGADLNIGVFYVVAVSSFGILGILIAGWSSNNKFALVGAFRAVAQLVSYEIPLVVSLLTVTLVAGSMSMTAIVDGQSLANGAWYVVALPLAFLIFMIANLAETNRCPFDLLEADSEIVAGFHVEYSGMKYAMFMIGEYVHMLAGACLLAVLFFGGWRGPFVELLPPFWGGLLGLIYLLAKAGFFIFVMMWFRGTFPRFRIDHMLDFCWKFLTPLSLVNLLVTAFVIKLFQPGSSAGVPMAAGPLAFLGPWGQTLALLIANLVLAFITSLVVANLARQSQSRGLRAVAAVDN